MDFTKPNDLLAGTYPGLDWAYANPFYRNSLKDKSLIKQPYLSGFEDSNDPKEYNFSDEGSTGLSLIDDIFSDRTRSHKATIDEILSEIEERKQIKQENHLKINQSMCKCDTYLLELENLAKSSYTPDISRRRTALEHEIFGLESEKREQEIGCWRDLVFIKKDLLTALGEYWGSLRKGKIMNMDFLSSSLSDGINDETKNSGNY